MKVKHLGVVLDGNRRFAKKLMMQPWKGHEWGANKVKKLLEWCKEFDIKELTLYSFSMQNFNRPKKEFDYLMDLLRKEFDELMQEDKLKELKEKGLRVRTIGRINLFPKDVTEKLKKITELTKDNKEYTVNFALAYGGKEEIVDAIKKIVAKGIKPEEVDQELIAKNLYMKDEPDLIIRTGGEQRTSNFLMWQSSYSEWVFLEKPWPEFEKEDLKICLNDFEQRQRRYGK